MEACTVRFIGIPRALTGDSSLILSILKVSRHDATKRVKKQKTVGVNFTGTAVNSRNDGSSAWVCNVVSKELRFLKCNFRRSSRFQPVVVNLSISLVQWFTRCLRRIPSSTFASRSQQSTKSRCVDSRHASFAVKASHGVIPEQKFGPRSETLTEVPHISSRARASSTAFSQLLDAM